jgi:hypothetical protein
VGISTSSMSAKMVINQASSSDALIIQRAAGVSGNTTFSFPSADSEIDATNNMRLATGGTERIRISAGSTIFKAPDGGSRYLFGGTGNSDNAELSLYNSSDAQKVRIGAGVDSFFNGGKVGIGTSSPAKPLTVVGGDFSTVLLDTANASHGTQILFQANGAANSGADIQMSDAGGLKIRTLAVEPLSFHTAASAGTSTERLRLDTSGNVGIGESSPGNYYNSPLVVKVPDEGGITIAVANTYAHQAYLYFADDDSGAARYAGYLAYDHQTDRLGFGAAGSRRMSLDSGSLGVGVDAESASARIHAQETNNRHAGFFHNTNTSMSSNTLQVSTSRNTTNSSYNHFTCSIHGIANKMAVRDSGAIVSTNNSIGSISDQRMKENIVDAASQWDDIKAVQVRKYNRIGETQKELGVIAQELEASGMDGLVDESEWFDVVANPNNEVRKSVKYSILYMKAVKALQEAMTRIETLETENSTQATQIADLITRVTALEAS